MKTLENQTILYDEDCPLCQAYTSAFVKTGMLDKNGRKPYCDIDETEQEFIDTERAANEIALVDYKTKTVLYGIESLLKIIGNSFPWIEKIGHLAPVNYFLKKTYSFISYNRKVIMPSVVRENQTVKCEPTFNHSYRITYLILAVLVTTLVLFECSKLLPQLPESSIWREFSLAVGQIGFQSLFLIRSDRKKLLTYLGNMMTVSLFGSLLLLPIIIASKFTTLSGNLILIWFGITVMLMLKEHFRRITLLKLPVYLTPTWVLYRIIALFIILNF
ncbi:DCC1-like thiol-disulfide oxidoreductase family protein [Flavobacterium suncheonense]|uniref:DCC1-like thiol-disulfide oxidoreductase family protein n=1 Tax=Flavobacterium suncheonense TaxID=350894 RepID=UPI003FA3723F